MFGHVVSGQQYVTEMENQKVDANHRPYADVRISNCGELVLMRSMSSSTNLCALIAESQLCSINITAVLFLVTKNISTVLVVSRLP